MSLSLRKTVAGVSLFLEFHYTPEDWLTKKAAWTELISAKTEVEGPDGFEYGPELVELFAAWAPQFVESLESWAVDEFEGA